MAEIITIPQVRRSFAFALAGWQGGLKNHEKEDRNASPNCRDGCRLVHGPGARPRL
jgi:hypothetical protein